SVDLPHPERPTRETNSPGCTSKEVGSSACVTLAAPTNVFSISRTRSSPPAMPLSSPARRPMEGTAVESAEEEIEAEAEHAEDDQVHENLRCLQKARELEDAIDEPLVGGDELGDDE